MIIQSLSRLICPTALGLVVAAVISALPVHAQELMEEEKVEVEDGSAEESAEMALARELMEMMRMSEQLAAMEDQMLGFSRSMLDAQDMPEAQRERAAEISAASMKATLQELQNMDFEGMYAEVYAEVFTEEELQGILDFYQSPAGQKMLDKQNELAAATMNMMSEMMGDLMPKIEKQVQEAMQEAAQGE